MSTKKTWGISGTKLPISDNYSAYIKLDSKSIMEYLRNKIIIVPDFQRDLDEDKIQQIVSEYIYRNKKGENYLIKHGWISLCKIGDKLFLIDGQHRIESMKRLCLSEYNPDMLLRVQICSNIEEMTKDFRLLNSNSNIPLIYKQFKNEFSQKILLELKSKLKKEYNSFHTKHNTDVSKSKRLHIDQFLDLFKLDKLDNSSHSIDTLIDKILDINAEVELYIMHQVDNINWYISKTDLKAIQKSNFYLSLANIKWVDKVFNDNIDIDYLPINYKKKNINASLREKVFNRDFGYSSNIGPCFVCQKQIDRASSHIGHIIAEYMGGATELSNLKAICSSCNLSMGTQNMYKFKELNYGFHN
jgi:hypothetical protein